MLSSNHILAQVLLLEILFDKMIAFLLLCITFRKQDWILEYEVVSGELIPKIQDIFNALFLLNKESFLCMYSYQVSIYQLFIYLFYLSRLHLCSVWTTSCMSQDCSGKNDSENQAKVSHVQVKHHICCMITSMPTLEFMK